MPRAGRYGGARPTGERGERGDSGDVAVSSAGDAGLAGQGVVAGSAIPEDWLAAVPFLRQGRHRAVLEAVAARREQGTVYPPESLVFNALHLTPLAAVRVVIVGQDPYHGPGQAHGLAFSVPEATLAAGARMPPSLRNIFKEIDAQPGGENGRGGHSDHGGHADMAGRAGTNHVPGAHSPDLTRWAVQGVLLLNTTLTVDAGRPASHARLGWDELTDDIIRTVSERCASAVFMLWGAHAHQKAALVDPARHLVLEAAHPSPFSAHRGFFGCGHFARANAWLAQHGAGGIVW
ncbi:uracil-DNA glycosylase [Desulfovibrio psychrotolerans]|uniref:Uracil-DNA glycosylase n=1 Tax=Desulfovibrio psychrotolerans TaxID=415242 RepID=A0A7J0BXB1_9BACT|nr:uracil-DNA glycosylase [Desulfovibrio psychrotolerans]GFM37812.1 uracil-DNA glycosylase [Desulfovibrio psychrotolerans]